MVVDLQWLSMTRSMRVLSAPKMENIQVLLLMCKYTKEQLFAMEVCFNFNSRDFYAGVVQCCKFVLYLRSGVYTNGCMNVVLENIYNIYKNFTS